MSHKTAKRERVRARELGRKWLELRSLCSSDEEFFHRRDAAIVRYQTAGVDVMAAFDLEIEYAAKGI